MQTRQKARNGGGIAARTLAVPPARGAARWHPKSRPGVPHTAACALVLVAAACADATAPTAPVREAPRPAADLRDTASVVMVVEDPGRTLQERLSPSVIKALPRQLPTVARRMHWYAANPAVVSEATNPADTINVYPEREFTLLVDGSDFKDLASMHLAHTVTSYCTASVETNASKPPYTTGVTSVYTSPGPAASSGDPSFAPKAPPSSYLFGYLVWEAFDPGVLKQGNDNWCWVKAADIPGAQTGKVGRRRAKFITFTLTYTTKGTPYYPATTKVESRTFSVDNVILK